MEDEWTLRHSGVSAVSDSPVVTPWRGDVIDVQTRQNGGVTAVIEQSECGSDVFFGFRNPADAMTARGLIEAERRQLDRDGIFVASHPHRKTQASIVASALRGLRPEDRPRWLNSQRLRTLARALGTWSAK